MPRWPKREEGMEKSFEARRRKPATSKTDLEPPIDVLRRTGCPPRGGIRRVCGEVSGCKSSRQAQDFLSAHAFIYGHFHPRRHQVAAHTYRAIRSDALKTWHHETCLQYA